LAVHVVAGFPDPLFHYLVSFARLGFRASALERTGSLRPQRLPLPASWLLSVVEFGLATPNTYFRIQAASLALA